jgi:hypothetical protein
VEFLSDKDKIVAVLKHHAMKAYIATENRIPRISTLGTQSSTPVGHILKMNISGQVHLQAASVPGTESAAVSI